MANHLKNEDSPYLQQHLNNLVDWYPWADEAFKRAKKENKPIFLSIGYSSSTWCNVMKEGSFNNAETADILNRYFISIKVDKEERPDIDRHFKDVYKLMNSQIGGSPLSIFLTDDLKPFYSASYIPAKPNYGMMSFSSLLHVIVDKYQNEKELLTEKADEILRFLNPKNDKIEATKLDISILKRVNEQAKQLFDIKDGGFNTAPKFPQASTLSLLLDTYSLTEDKEILDMVSHSLFCMAKGGLRDIVDGGFCRYSTDTEWLIPHFEKTTYDNALLSEVYIKAYNITEDKFYKNVAFETIEFMLKNMSEESLFYSASNGIEEKYFLYSYEEAIAIFDKADIPTKEHQSLAKALNITEDGNLEDKSIIRVDNPKDVNNIPYYKKAIEALKNCRTSREYPSVDKKIIVSWNAMMIKSIFKASRVDNSYLNIAIKSLDTLLDRLYINSELFHSVIIGKKPKIKAFLEDYAYLADTLIEAYQTTLDEKYLIIATKLINSSIEQYFNNGKWKFSSGEFETDADIYDSSYPSSIATILSALYSLSSLVDSVYKKFVFKTLEINSYNLMRQPISSPSLTRMVLRYIKDDIIINPL